MFLQMRDGYGRSVFEKHLPLILGRDISGEVAAVGDTVRSLRVGQEVFGALHPTAVRGTYTDYAILAEDELIQKPESISHVVRFLASNYALIVAWNTIVNVLTLNLIPLVEPCLLAIQN